MSEDKKEFSPQRLVHLLLLGGFLSLLVILLCSLLSPPIFKLHPLAQTDAYIFFNLRLPKYITAFFAGAALALSGSTFQTILKNPLADPYILGISGGAALGFVTGVIFGMPAYTLPVFGFVFALGTLFLLTQIAKASSNTIPNGLLLSGVVFNSLAFALVLLAHSLASWADAQQILFFLLGAIEAPEPHVLLIFAACVTAASSVLIIKSRVMNVMTLPDDEATSLGLHFDREQQILLITVAVLVGASVAVCGLIGFVGLFVPHAVRLLWGFDHRLTIPLSAFMGGMVLVASEFFLTVLSSPDFLGTRLPVGVLTALFGAPLFFILIQRPAR